MGILGLEDTRRGRHGVGLPRRSEFAEQSHYGFAVTPSAYHQPVDPEALTVQPNTSRVLGNRVKQRGWIHRLQASDDWKTRSL